MSYRHEIDGLRGIAVIAICLFHTQHSYFSNGFIGVDIFFVISGYLITGLIVKPRGGREKFSLSEFYLRRARRLFPALFLMMLVCIPFAWLWMFSSQYKDFSQSLISSSVFGSNILFWLESQQYFAASASLKPLLHTWSLSLEEQFYLFYPLLLLLLLHCTERSRFLFLTLITLLFGIHSVFFIQNPITGYYMLHARVWLFGVGALTYFMRKRGGAETRNFSAYLAFIGLVCILFTLISPVLYSAFPILSLNKQLWAGVSVFGVSTVLLFAAPSNLTGRILTTSILTRVGIISYSLYLWHYPLFVFARLRLLTLSPNTYLCLFAVAFFFAYLSWRYIEVPFRKKNFISVRYFSFFITSAALFIVTTGVYGVVKDGYVYGMGENETALNLNYGLNANCQFSNNIPACQTGNSPEILVWGDSFAMHSVDVVRGAKANVSMVQLTMSACSPIIHETGTSFKDNIILRHRDITETSCSTFRSKVISSIESLPTLKYAVISSRLSNIFKRHYEETLSDASEELLINKAFEDVIQTLDLLRDMGVKPVIISEPRRPLESKIYCAAHALKFNGNTDSCAFLDSDISNPQRMVNRLLQRVEAHYDVIWLDSYICQNQVCNTVADNINLYTLGGHLSSRGARLIGSKLGVYDRIVNQK